MVHLPERDATLVVIANSDVPQPHSAGQLANVVTSIATPEHTYELGPQPPQLVDDPAPDRTPSFADAGRARIAVVRIGMTMPVMEPNLDAATLKAWARVVDGGPFSSSPASGRCPQCWA